VGGEKKKKAGQQKNSLITAKKRKTEFQRRGNKEGDRVPIWFFPSTGSARKKGKKRPLSQPPERKARIKGVKKILPAPGKGVGEGGGWDMGAVGERGLLKDKKKKFISGKGVR